MALKSIEEEWQGFAGMVFRGMTPSDTQLAEMKKSFFAGAWALFCMTQEMGEPHVSDREAMAFLSARRAECERFRQKILDEYANKN